MTAVLTPKPIETLQLPKQGRNRAPASQIMHINADNDLQAIQIWLQEFANSQQTLRTYRKEAERLLLWNPMIILMKIRGV